MRARRLLLAAAATALVALAAGCAHHDGASPKAPSGTASATAPSAGPSQVAEMQKKVDAAQSAAAAADRDATSPADR
ncbi:hypothetical protein AB5J72_46930 [Streptomyces sp. CG1]|uniref:hypothetical protein n=1 Tax=Streptomyces sp. CG1 TaxID=1287523 RepID=UPI0034E19AE0